MSESAATGFNVHWVHTITLRNRYIYTYFTILIRYIMNIVQLYIEICGANLFIYLFVNPSSSPVEKVRGHQK